MKPRENDASREIVGEFARRMDANDFEGAAAMLADDCHYEFRGTIFVGRDAIMAEYRKNDGRARHLLDEIAYESVIEEAVEGAVPVRYIDRLRKGTRTCEHACRQWFTVGGDGRIARIVHEDVPGERERLAAFFRECGIPWP